LFHDLVQRSAPGRSDRLGFQARSATLSLPTDPCERPAACALSAATTSRYSSSTRRCSNVRQKCGGEPVARGSVGSLPPGFPPPGMVAPERARGTLRAPIDVCRRWVPFGWPEGCQKFQRAARHSFSTTDRPPASRKEGGSKTGEIQTVAVLRVYTGERRVPGPSLRIRGT